VVWCVFAVRVCRREAEVDRRLRRSFDCWNNIDYTAERIEDSVTGVDVVLDTVGARCNTERFGFSGRAESPGNEERCWLPADASGAPVHCSVQQLIHHKEPADTRLISSE
jgi:hypothetical protein